jgi:hypothetical protein
MNRSIMKIKKQDITGLKIQESKETLTLKKPMRLKVIITMSTNYRN